ncbi:hypothetical protein GCM10022244_60250 [Streptomyces gulbargensis]|uniref:Uncharacterized protein n=1 Tax=Streptomyces gulbargensis TaxID=364901 RepID=A0ABP7NEQ3_9ACTN
MRVKPAGAEAPPGAAEGAGPVERPLGAPSGVGAAPFTAPPPPQPVAAAARRKAARATALGLVREVIWGSARFRG